MTGLGFHHLFSSCHLLFFARCSLFSAHCTYLLYSNELLYNNDNSIFFLFCYLLDQLNNFLKMTFENKTLLLKEFEYSITLRGLLKEQFEVKNLHGVKRVF